MCTGRLDTNVKPSPHLLHARAVRCSGRPQHVHVAAGRRPPYRLHVAHPLHHHQPALLLPLLLLLGVGRLLAGWALLLARPLVLLRRRSLHQLSLLLRLLCLLLRGPGRLVVQLRTGMLLHCLPSFGIRQACCLLRLGGRHAPM